MTKEEIQDAKMISQEAVADVMRSPVQTDEVEAAVLLLPQALDALEDANREIERLSAVAKKLGAWDCEKCQRMFVESMLTISPHSAVCDSCLGESTT